MSKTLNITFRCRFTLDSLLDVSNLSVEMDDTRCIRCIQNTINDNQAVTKETRGKTLIAPTNRIRLIDASSLIDRDAFKILSRQALETSRSSRVCVRG